MEKRQVERLFVWLIYQVADKYQEEVNMAMDCFLEETYTQAELERFLAYVLDRVKADAYDAAFDRVQQEIAHG